MNISLMANKSKKEYAYTMIDVESEVSGQIAKALEAVEGVLKVRAVSYTHLYNTMMEEIRAAIEAGEYQAYKKKKIEGMTSGK